jgi:Spy/CpxP family protein refolding chaperone
MASAFEALRAAILAIYTPAQRAWLEANKVKQCGPDGGPQLTEAQLAQIKALKDGFETTYRADITTIRTVAAEAKTARAAGKSDAEVRAILAKAAEARDRVREGEKKLYADIMALLTAEQRAAWCVGRGMRGAGGPVGNG